MVLMGNHHHDDGCSFTRRSALFSKVVLLSGFQSFKNQGLSPLPYVLRLHFFIHLDFYGKCKCVQFLCNFEIPLVATKASRECRGE